MVSSFMARPRSRTSSMGGFTPQCEIGPRFPSGVARLFPGDLLMEPGAGVGPVALGGRRGDAEEPGRLGAGEAAEIAQLDQLRLDRVLSGQLAQRLVDGQQVVVRLPRRGLHD